ncbi:MAG TPA: acetate--CoA ligase [Dehalococcoidia bacterium]|nr:acetate--CoA ligase [Dehalococcoidia bacterium]
MPDETMQLVNPIVQRWRRDATEDPESFWTAAAEQLPWFKPWSQVLEWPSKADGPAFRWFVGGETNIAYNAVDRHVKGGRGGVAALVALNERGERNVLTYAMLQTEVKRTAAALRALGIGKGDRVAIYMPTCAEAIVLMLACLRIGAIHLVVFAGFGGAALAERIKLAGARALFASDSTYRRGNLVDFTGILDTALNAEGAGKVVQSIVIQQRNPESKLPAGAITYPEFLERGAGGDSSHVAMEANEPAYILATSGTTARPKLAVHTHGGYQVYIHAMANWNFGLKPNDVWWATSDIGWVVGHSYMVYAPLLVGCTTLCFEGAIDYPNMETIYRLLSENGVTGVFTSPTAIRVLMRAGADSARKYDLSAIQRVFSAGEVLNPPAWEWFQKEIFQDRVPVIDHMWQTETGGPIVGNPYGLGLLPIKPGAAGVPLPGIEAAIMTPEGEVLGPGEKGIFVIKRPFPGLTAQLWAEPERYGADYWQKMPGQTVYFSGDAAHVDEDGYYWFSGRADEIIKIAAHRLGTIEVESAILRHAAVAEAGVTGRPDEIRGEVISAFVVLKNGFEASDDLRKQVIATVRNELGPIAVIGELNFVNGLPKTRSGKIMRRVLKAVTLDVDPGDISTIEDEGSVEDARAAWSEMKASIGR